MWVLDAVVKANKEEQEQSAWRLLCLTKDWGNRIMKRRNNGASNKNKRHNTKHNFNQAKITAAETCGDVAAALAVDENQLLAEIASGAHWALGTIYYRYVDKVSDFVCRILEPYGLSLETDDVTIDAFKKLEAKASELSAERTILPWLKRVARNEALDRIRPVKRLLKRFGERKSVDDESVSDTVGDSRGKSPREKVILHEDLERVMQLIRELPDGIRDIFEDFIFEGLSIEQLSKKYSKANGSVTWRIHHARELIKQQFAL